MNGGFREVRQDADGGLRKFEAVWERWWWWGSTHGCCSSWVGSGLGGDRQRGNTEKDLAGESWDDQGLERGTRQNGSS